MKVSDLRGILTYVPRFREKIFVIAVDGEIAASPNFGNILLDLAVLRSLSVKIILVHGAAFQIEKLAKAMSLATEDEVKDLKRQIRRLEEEVSRLEKK